MKYARIAALVAGLFAAPVLVHADNANVTVYGIAQAGVSIVNNDDVTKTIIEDTGSRIGFKGEEDLGNGLSAFFKIESKVRLDDASASGFANREGWLGLKGDFGTVKLGRGKTYFDLAQENFDGFNGNSTMINSLLIDGVYYRSSNNIAYETPNLGGFVGKLQYGDMEGKTNNVTPSAVIGSLEYNVGSLQLIGAFESQRDLAPIVADGTKPVMDGARIKNYLLGAGYTLPAGTNFKLAYRQSNFSLGPVDTDRDTIIGVVSQPFGNATARIGYTHVGDLDGVDNSGGDYLALGVDYAVSKRTIVYTEFSRATNEKNNVSLLETSAGQAGALGTKRNNSAWTTGIIHLF